MISPGLDIKLLTGISLKLDLDFMQAWAQFYGVQLEWAWARYTQPGPIHSVAPLR